MRGRERSCFILQKYYMIVTFVKQQPEGIIVTETWEQDLEFYRRSLIQEDSFGIGIAEALGLDYKQITPPAQLIEQLRAMKIKPEDRERRMPRIKQVLAGNALLTTIGIAPNRIASHLVEHIVGGDGIDPGPLWRDLRMASEVTPQPFAGAAYQTEQLIAYAYPVVFSHNEQAYNITPGTLGMALARWTIVYVAGQGRKGEAFAAERLAELLEGITMKS